MLQRVSPIIATSVKHHPTKPYNRYVLVKEFQRLGPLAPFDGAHAQAEQHKRIVGLLFQGVCLVLASYSTKTGPNAGRAMSSSSVMFT